MKIPKLKAPPRGLVFTHEILEGGLVKTTSGKVAMPIHSAAEKMLSDMATELGGASTRTNLPHSHRDTGHHVHGGHGHQH